jgi:HAD superfamily hydrolase (TIGR01509 family)
MKLHHVGIEVRDLYAVELFYRKALGFTLRYRYVSKNTPGLRTVFLERDGLQLELLERPRGDDFLARRAYAPDHLSLDVPRADDVDAEHLRLAALGFPGAVVKPPRNTGDGFRELTLRDPEGNVIEISARIGPEPRDPVRAVLFDFDGTLVDSEENYYRADKELMARRGVEFTEADKRRYIGGSNADMMLDLVRRFGLREDPAALGVEKNRLYLEIAEKATRVYPEMKRFWDQVRGRGLPVAVASGSSPQVIARLLEVTGLAGEVEVVVSAEEVPRGKPAPDVFLEAARRLGVAPHECAVVEDARFGVEAARRAFMRCIAVPYLHEKPLDDAFLMADLLFEDGMETFDAARALEWLAGQGR